MHSTLAVAAAVGSPNAYPEGYKMIFVWKLHTAIVRSNSNSNSGTRRLDVRPASTTAGTVTGGQFQ